MISGSKNDSRIKKGKKQKLVLAKDNKQLYTAIVVVCLFVINSIGMIIKYVQEQNPTSMNTSSLQPPSDKRPGDVSMMDSANPSQTDAMTNPALEDALSGTTSTSTPANPNQQSGTLSAPPQGGAINGNTSTNTTVNSITTESLNGPQPVNSSVGTNQPVGVNAPSEETTLVPTSTENLMQPQIMPSQGNGNPVFPIIIVLVLMGVIAVAIKYFFKKNSAAASQKESPIFALTKNRQQLYIVAGILCAFFIVSIYSINQYYKNQNAAILATIQSPEEAIGINQPGNIDEPNAVNSAQTPQQDANNIYSQAISLQTNKISKKLSLSSLSKDDVEIIPKKTTPKKAEKKVSIVVDNSGRSNPFLPLGENISSKGGKAVVLPYLTMPPETLPSGSDAEKVMTTTISGILYDKYSPSAIINIEGADYLVKQGDVINHYKILSIGKTQVLVQLGKNVYHAGVGELLSPTDLNYNTIANLNKKFGGNDVSISVRKKGY